MVNLARDFHLSCGCHNPIVDILIVRAADKIRSMPKREERKQPAKEILPAQDFIFHTENGNGTMRTFTKIDTTETVKTMRVSGYTIVVSSEFWYVKGE